MHGYDIQLFMKLSTLILKFNQLKISFVFFGCVIYLLGTAF